MNNLTIQDTDDAWGRRIVRDLNSMPPVMRYGFNFEPVFDRVCLICGLLSLVLTAILMFLTVSNTWLNGGKQLISDSPYLIFAVITLVVGLVVQFIMPRIYSFIFRHWYYKVRENFAKS